MGRWHRVRRSDDAQRCDKGETRRFSCGATLHGCTADNSTRWGRPLRRDVRRQPAPTGSVGTHTDAWCGKQTTLQARYPVGRRRRPPLRRVGTHTTLIHQTHEPCAGVQGGAERLIAGRRHASASIMAQNGPNAAPRVAPRREACHPAARRAPAAAHRAASAPPTDHGRRCRPPDDRHPRTAPRHRKHCRQTGDASPSRTESGRPAAASTPVGRPAAAPSSRQPSQPGVNPSASRCIPEANRRASSRACAETPFSPV